mgnify:CR=1 FL=1
MQNVSRILDRRHRCFSCAEYDLYKFADERRIIEKSMSVGLPNKSFQTRWMTECELNCYGAGLAKNMLANCYDWLTDRTGAYRDDEEG